MKTYKSKNILLRYLSVLISIAIITGVLSLIQVSAGAEAEPDIWDGTVATGFESGTGTEDDPYIIKTPEQLAYLASTVNSGTTYEETYIKLANDIYLNNTDNWENWGTNAPENMWIPIGKPLTQIDELNFFSIMKSEYTFMGKFDGNNHVVYGIYTAGNDDYQGLFGCIKEGTVKNLNIEKSYVCGNRFVGGITGASFAAFINNCRNNGIVAGKDTYAGGISGFSRFISLQIAGSEYWDKFFVCDTDTGIENCINSGRVIGSGSVGGICGTGGYHDSIDNCYNKGTVSGCCDVGGICGYIEEVVEIRNCYNTGSVSGTDSYIGGVVGEIKYDSGATYCCNAGTVNGGGSCVGGICGISVGCGVARCCYNTGTVIGNHSVGGISGCLTYCSGVEDCYNTGNVTGNGSSIGGICGRSEPDIDKIQNIIRTSYNTGKVKGDCYVGGVCGYTDNIIDSSSIVNCYYLNACATDGRDTVQYGFGTGQSGSSSADISGCTTGLSEIQMTSESSFVGFSFEERWYCWKMPAAGSAYKYPVFQEEIAPNTGDSAIVFVIVALVSLFGMGIVIRSRRDY